MSQPFITIITPAYNRANTLPRLYKSLLLQKFKSFIWLIVDDGSTDNTEKLITEYIAAGRICISYYYHENGGKHRALNYGIKQVKTEASFIVDSDDWLSPDALQLLWETWNQIPDNIRRNFSGVAGLCAYENNQIIGTDYKFDTAYLDTHPAAYTLKNKITGDKISFHLTDILKQFPFPEIEGEKFISESIVWNKISYHYKQRLINHTLLYKEYLDGGLTSNSLRLRVDNAQGSVLVYSTEIAYLPFTLRGRVKSYINLVRFMLHSGSICYKGSITHKLMLLLMYIPAFLIFIIDKQSLKK
jgi:glycosyltransferase involved in cell wall biosynthesis